MIAAPGLAKPSDKATTAPSAEDDPVAELERAVTDIVRWSTSREVQNETMRRAQCQVPFSAVAMLHRIWTTGPVHPSELAAYYCVDNSTITPRLQRLERAGLVARHPDPKDGRAALVKITQAGQRLRKRLHEARRRMLDELLQELSPTERRRLAQAAGRLAGRLELPSAPGLRKSPASDLRQ